MGHDGSVTVTRASGVLRVGELEPTFETELVARYEIPKLPDGPQRAEFLAERNDLRIERIREARVNRMPCILVDATMPSEAGLMRSRSVFLEDG